MLEIYNHLNLPQEITSSGATGGVIKYWYAGAAKVKKIVDYTDAAKPDKVTDYIGGLVYENNTLEFIPTSEGRAVLKTSIFKNPDGSSITPPTTGGLYMYEYQLKDHLGNLRVACRCGDPSRDAAGIIIPPAQAGAGLLPLRNVQENHYDPWGMSLGTPPDKKQANNNHRWQYNGKELVEDFDIGLYEYGFRWYDAQIARFPSVDPLADDYAYKSTYDYAENDPISFIDLDGAEKAIYDPNSKYGVNFISLSDNQNSKRILKPITIVSQKTIFKFNSANNRTYFTVNNFPNRKPPRMGESNTAKPNLLYASETEKVVYDKYPLTTFLANRAGEVDNAATYGGPIFSSNKSKIVGVMGSKFYNSFGKNINTAGGIGDLVQGGSALYQGKFGDAASSGADLFLESKTAVTNTAKFLGYGRGASAFAGRVNLYYFIGAKIIYPYATSDYMNREVAQSLYNEYYWYDKQSWKYYDTGNFEKFHKYSERAEKIYDTHEKVVTDLNNPK